MDKLREAAEAVCDDFELRHANPVVGEDKYMRTLREERHLAHLQVCDEIRALCARFATAPPAERDGKGEVMDKLREAAEAVIAHWQKVDLSSQSWSHRMGELICDMEIAALAERDATDDKP